MTGVICNYDCIHRGNNKLCRLEAIILINNDDVNIAVRCEMKESR
jgi:hypothetical protein